MPGHAPFRGLKKQAGFFPAQSKHPPKMYLKPEQEEQNMKKRFLSAALALAMVLTLLPLSVMSASAAPIDDATVSAPAEGQTVTVSNGKVTWQYKVDGKTLTSDPVALASMTGGVIGGSNTWYSSVDNALDAGKTSIILCRDSDSISSEKAAKLSSLSIDLNGHSMSASTLTVSSADNTHRLGSLTLTNSAYTGSKAASNITVSVTGKSFKVAATNVTMSGISVTGKGGAGTVTLTNADTSTVTLGELMIENKKTVSSTQSLTLSGSSTISGNAIIDGNNSTVSVTDSTITGAVKITGTAASRGNLTVAGWSSSVGTVTLCGSENSDVTSGTGPKVVITGGTVSSIGVEGTEYLSAPNYNITVSGSGTVSSGITLGNATISVDGGTVTGAIAQANGSLSITGGATVAGGVTWGSSAGGSLKLTISGGNTTVGAIAPASGNTASVSTVSISGGTMATVNLGGYAGHGITGGTFSGSLLDHPGYLASDLKYEITSSSGSTYSYVSGTDVNKVFQAVVDNYKTGDTVRPVDTCDKNGSVTTTFKFTKDGAEAVVVITAAATDVLRLPTTVSGRPVAVWYDASNSTKTYNDKFLVGSSDATLVASVTTKEEFITSVSIDSSSAIQGVSAELVGNTIKLTNAVNLAAGDRATIVLNVKTGSKPDGYQVSVIYYNADGTVMISSADSVFTYSGNKLILNDKTYTVDGSGLKAMAAGVVAQGIDGSKGKVVANTSRVGGLTAGDKAALKTALEGTTTVDFSKSPAVVEAITRQMSGISQSTANGYVTAAKRAKATKYKNDNGLKDTVNDAFIAAHGGSYNTVVVRAYLYIDVSDYKGYGSGAVGSMSANITPYYEIVVTGSGEEDYVAKAGSSLGTLTGDLGEVEISIDVPNNFVKAGSSVWVHHGDYVYKTTVSSQTVTFKTLHGFSPFVFNGAGYIASVGTVSGGTYTPATYYDTLQAAINCAKDGEEVLVGDGYTGPTALTVTGTARTFTVNCGNNKALRLTFAGADANQGGTYDNYYTVTLEKDTAAATTKLTVNAADNGSASLSAASAVPGATVTGTIKPSTGFMAGSFTATAQTTTGGSVNVTVKVDAANNTFSFVVPNNAVSVVVTPVFVVGDGRVVIGVASALGGSATTSAAASENKAAPGATVTVTTVPNNGYRTIGLTAQTNTGATVAVTRTGLNAFSMVVPTGAVTVTVTPSFDIDTGTPFADVLSSHWATKYVTWAYQTKYVEGTGTYAFSPATYITRGEVVAMLWKAEGKPIVNYANPFKDVPTNYWAYDAVMWAASKGLIDTSSSYFMPTGYASRAEVVTILYKRANSPAVYGTSGFADVPASAAYSKAVTWARQNKLTNGYGGSTYFRPNYAISRAEVTTFLARAFGNIA